MDTKNREDLETFGVANILKNREHSWVKHTECNMDGKPLTLRNKITYGYKWVYYRNAYSGGHAGRPWAHPNFEHSKKECLKNRYCRAVTYSPCCHG